MDRVFDTHFFRLASASWFKRHQGILSAFFGQLPLDQINPSLITEFREKRVREGKSPAYVNRSLAVLRKSLNLAYEMDWLDRPVIVRLLPEPPGRDRWVSSDEEAQILSACPRWLREIVLTSLYSGLRLGEVLSLRWEHIDLDRQVLYVHKSKNRDRRSIPLHPKLSDMLKGKDRLTLMYSLIV
jgi:integrase